MTAAQWNRVKAIVAEAAELEGAEREVFLNEACGQDAELLHQVHSLLQAHDGIGSWLDEPVVPPGLIAGTLEQARTSEILIAETLGPYRITRLLGEGGMGAVFEGIREEGGISLKVAIKTLRYRDGASRLKEHFRNEQRILARLTHPAIARLIDWGVAPDGRPFLVMEYVEGVPFSEYLRQAPSLRARLLTFLRVLEAVDHAHRQLVAHGDIKPGNIRVMPDGSIKLLDFGIARFLNDSENESMPAWTRTYTSPEVLAGESLTSACDVFSLGVLLCETVAGCKPYRVTSATRQEALRELASQQPSRPSVLAPERHISRELDSIVLKAAAMSPGQRYPSVSALADDVKAWLERRPVKAHSSRSLYRVSKFASRHATVLAAGVLAAGVLGVSVTISLWQGRVAQQRFEQLRSLANYIIFDLNNRLLEIPAGTAVRAELVQRATTYLDQLNLGRRHDRELTREVAHSYLRLGDVQGRPSRANLGNTRGAMESYEKAIRLFVMLHRDDPVSKEARDDAATAFARMAAILKASGRFKEALAYDKQALEMAGSLLLDSPQDNAVRRRVAHYSTLVGASHYHLGEWDAATEVRKQTLALWQEIAKDDQSIPSREGLALAHNRVAVMEARAGRFREAEQLQAKTLELYRDLTLRYLDNLPVRRGYATAWHYMGSVLLQAGQLEESRKHLETALAMRQRIIEEDPDDVRNKSFHALHQYELSECLRRLGLTADALRQIEQSLRTRRELAALDPANAGAQAEVALALARLALIRGADGDAAGQKSALSESVALFQALREKELLNAPTVEEMEQAIASVGALDAR